jgi:hypothetical protein
MREVLKNDAALKKKEGGLEIYKIQLLNLLVINQNGRCD